MALPSFSPIELQVLISIVAVLIFIGSFLALLVSVEGPVNLNIARSR